MLSFNLGSLSGELARIGETPASEQAMDFVAGKANYELDHIVSLSLGGQARKPQPEAQRRDRVSTWRSAPLQTAADRLQSQKR